MAKLNKKAVLVFFVVCILITVFSGCMGEVDNSQKVSGKLLKMGSYYKGDCVSYRGSHWPFILHITSIESTSGKVTGELEWPTLKGITRISGHYFGDKFTFTETEHVVRGDVALHCEYILYPQDEKMSGIWSCPAASDSGTIYFNL